jgi:DNA-binding Xre family transcriptional regulator
LRKFVYYKRVNDNSLIFNEVIELNISATKIEILQAEKGMTAANVAENAGMCRQNISTIKRRGTCTPITAAKLAKALGVDVADLIESK